MPSTAINDQFTTDETTIITGSVFDDNGSGADTGDAPLAITSVNGDPALVGQQITLESGALLTLNADGSFEYDPKGVHDGLNTGFSVDESFTYQINGVAAAFDLNALGGDAGFSIGGIDPSDFFGRAVSSAGDVNGDGFDDIIIGAPGGDPNVGGAGETYVVFGTADGFDPDFQVTDLDGTNGFVLNGDGRYDRSGSSVGSAGDINGDGFDDVVVELGGDGGADNSGRVAVIFGSDEVFPASFEVSDLDGSNGFIINGTNERDFIGRSVASAGDLNGDGFDDIIIGADGVDTNGGYSGEAYVIFGTDAGFDASLDVSDLDGTNGFTVQGITAGDQLGYSAASAGDINGDGFDDIVIGASGVSATGYGIGATYVVFGTDTGFDATLDVSGLNGTNGFVINGVSEESYSGRSVSSAGDINGDGFDDIVIGAPEFGDYSTTGGTAFVVFGSDTGFDATVELSDLDGTNGFSIKGESANDRVGISVSGAGDINGDGIDDIIIGANGVDGGGAAYVVFGSTDGFDASLDVTDIDGVNGFVIEGGNTGDRLGSSVSAAGDVNGDGFDDLIVGAEQSDSTGLNAGEAYIIFGGPSVSPNVATATITVEGVGVSVPTDGDDQLAGTDGVDVIDALGGDDVVLGFAGDDDIKGGTGDDTINGDTGRDTIFGQSGEDEIYGGGGADLLVGGGQNDLIFGGNGNDRINAGSGGDEVFGDIGTDNIFGNGGADDLHGGEGDDRLTGGGGNDIFTGGAGDDQISGGRGRDTFNIDAGADTMIGGSDKDLFIFTDQSDVGNVITDYQDGIDKLFAEGYIADDLVFQTSGADTVVSTDDWSVTFEGIEAGVITTDDFIFV